MGRALKEIVEAAAGGDQTAVKELIESTQSRMFKFCLVLCGDPVQAEDLSQEAYIKALTNLKKLKEPGAFIDWLFRVTRNLYIDQRRRHREQSLSPEETEKQEAPAHEMTEILAVHKVLSQFETDDRLLLVLVDMESYSYKDAGEILGISEAAVRSRLFRLRKIFVEKWQGPETK